MPQISSRRCGPPVPGAAHSVVRVLRRAGLLCVLLFLLGCEGGPSPRNNIWHADASVADIREPAAQPDAGLLDARPAGDVLARPDTGVDVIQAQEDLQVPQCPAGYQRQGGSCVDINECAQDPCKADESCTNTQGSYTCAANPSPSCTTWDNATNAPCAAGTYNCDCLGGCGATTPCSAPPQTSWPPTDYIEIANYHGRANGDRPTWYFSKKMSGYPNTFTVVVHGCLTLDVTSNNGTRFEKNGVIVKQSDVAGRGMAVVAPSSCKSTKCYIK